MTPEQRSALLAHCAAEMTGDRYREIRDLIDDHSTVRTFQLQRLVAMMRERDVRRANELLRKMGE